MCPRINLSSFSRCELGTPLLKLLNCKRNNNLKKPHPSTRGRKIASYQTLSPLRRTFVFLGSRCTQPLTPRNAHALRYEFSKWRTGQKDKRLNTGMAPTCDWMIKIVKVNKLYFNSLLVSVVNRVYQSGTMKYQCE